MAEFTQRYERPHTSDQAPFNVNNYIRDDENGWNSCILGKVGDTGLPDTECNVLANCTGYAQGRFNEIYNEINNTTGMHFYWFNNSASGWIDRAKEHYSGLIINQTPEAGALMIWQGLNGYADHVAFIEADRYKIDGTLIITESAYDSYVFRRRSINNIDKRWGRGANANFLGFIHPYGYNPKYADSTLPLYMYPIYNIF